MVSSNKNHSKYECMLDDSDLARKLCIYSQRMQYEMRPDAKALIMIKRSKATDTQIRLNTIAEGTMPLSDCPRYQIGGHNFPTKNRTGRLRGI